MNRIRVLQVQPNFGSGGGERVSLHLLRGLDPGAFEQAAVSLYDEVSPELIPELTTLGIPLFFLGKRRGPDPRMLWRFDRVLRDFRPHVVHTHRYVLRYCLPALVRRGVPVRVHTVHNLAMREVDRFGRLIHRAAFAAGVVPVAIAGAVEESLRDVYGSREYPVIPNGIPVAAFRPSPEGRRDWRERQGFSEEDVLLAAVGRLEPQKNHALLLRSFAAARAEQPHSHLLLAGEGFLDGDLRRHAAELGIGDRVRFLGFRADLPELLGACDALVVSSDWEGNPLSVMEAMAGGLPIVATAVGGIPELVEDGVSGLLVPPGDADRLSATLRRLLSDPELRRSLGEQAALRAARRFDVCVMVEEYADLYTRLLAERSPGRRRHRVVLNTANPNFSAAGYGGGKGGYGRMAGVLLTTFQADDIELVPCYHSARKAGGFPLLAFPYRFFSDALRFALAVRSADAVHLTLQYRSATPREFASLLIARLLRVPALVDIRAGQYISWFRSANRLYRAMARYVVRSAAAVTVEGLPYLDFLSRELGIEAIYFPNFVASSEVPARIPTRCASSVVKLLFVGYCYDGKGVKELAAGARAAAESGSRLQLTLVGEEHEEFAAWMDEFDAGALKIERLGTRSHDEVLERMAEHDVFCMPSRHPGEGHSNTVNEAMMMGQVIVCTRQGFLETVLGEDCCYFVERDSPESIAAALRRITEAPEEARQRAARARERLLSRFTSDAVMPVLESVYRRLIGAPRPDAAAPRKGAER